MIKASVVFSLFGAAIDEFMVLAMEVDVQPEVESYPLIIGTLLIAASVIGISAGYMRLETAPSVLVGAVMAALNPVLWITFNFSESTLGTYLIFSLITFIPCPSVFLLLKKLHARFIKPHASLDRQLS